MSSLDPIAAFVTARLAEEDADARAATAREPWLMTWTDDDLPAVIAETDAGPHIARQSPAATLARVEALRALVDNHGPTSPPRIRSGASPIRRAVVMALLFAWVGLVAFGVDQRACLAAAFLAFAVAFERDATAWVRRYVGAERWVRGGTDACPTLRSLAAIWRDHPDWREEWAVR
jgi:hypothetical protein